MRTRAGRGLTAAVLGAVFSVMPVLGMAAMAEAAPVIMIGEAAEGGNGMQDGRASNSLGIDVKRLPIPVETRQLVAVVGTGMDSSLVNVAYLKTAEDGTWVEQFCVQGFCGYNGMAEDKREGDRRTPTGSYGFACAFGILPDPGSILPYKHLDSGDFWVDDSNSRYYNQMVNTSQVVPDWNSAEELARIAPAYHYVLALDYNMAERVPGKGSAIFLHGMDTRKTWTEGCIAIPEEQVKQLVQELEPAAQIVILPAPQGADAGREGAE